MGAYTDADTAVRALWTAHWAHGSTYPVIWKANTVDVLPDPSSVSLWVQLRVGYLRERLQAVGGGSRANEKLLQGHVGISVYVPTGTGETAALAKLDDAINVFRSRRTGALSFIGEHTHPVAVGTADGNWWGRSATCAWTWRFTG